MANKQRLTYAVVDAAGHRRSLWWQFKVSKSDLYVAPGGMGFKLSFHSAGRFSMWAHDRASWSQERAEYFGRSSRQMESWTRAETPRNGSPVHVFSIVVPGEDEEMLRLEPPPSDPKPSMLRSAAAPFGRAVELRIFYSIAGPQRITAAPGNSVLAHLTLASDEFVYLVAGEVPFDFSKLGLPNSFNTKVPMPGTEIPVWPSRMRMALHTGPNELGVRAVIDVPVLQKEGAGRSEGIGEGPFLR